MKMTKIYTVQVLGIKDDGTIVRHRNWGWFQTKKEAEEIIINNITDIFERNYYNYALINEVPPGICIGHMKPEHWYKATYKKSDYDKKGYLKLQADPKVIPCNKPIDKRRIIGLDW